MSTNLLMELHLGSIKGDSNTAVSHSQLVGVGGAVEAPKNEETLSVLQPSVFLCWGWEAPPAWVDLTSKLLIFLSSLRPIYAFAKGSTGNHTSTTTSIATTSPAWFNVPLLLS